MQTKINGHFDHALRRVADAFRENFATRDELGACCCVYVQGRKVVDVWAGHLDAARQRPWPENGVVNVWSIGKAVSAIALLQLVDQQRLDVDEPVARYWPEFAANGKDDVLVSWLMSHRAGLPALRSPLPAGAYYDWRLMTHALANEAPWWRPGSAHGYHTNTLGFLIGELAHRMTGSRFRDIVQTNVTAALSIDFHLGIGAEFDARCADLTFVARTRESGADRKPLQLRPEYAAMRVASRQNPPLFAGGQQETNSRQWRAAEFPSTSVHSNARSVAAILDALRATLADGHRRLLSHATLQRATAVASDGTDLILERPTRFGLGLQLTQPDRPFGPNPGSFGHYGNGGHLAFTDPTAGVTFAYNMNHHGYAWRDPRNLALVNALYDSL